MAHVATQAPWSAGNFTSYHARKGTQALQTLVRGVEKPYLAVGWISGRTHAEPVALEEASKVATRICRDTVVILQTNVPDLC